MCEFSDKNMKRAAIQYLSDNPQALAINGLKDRLPYMFKPKCCAVCGQHLEEYERRPPSGCTRSLCDYHYNNLVPNAVGSPSCLVCGGLLGEYKINSQYNSPRELRNHIHEGKCLNAWALIHAVAVGEQDIIRSLNIQNYNQNPYEYPDSFYQGERNQNYQVTHAPHLDRIPIPRNRSISDSHNRPSNIEIEDGRGFKKLPHLLKSIALKPFRR